MISAVTSRNDMDRFGWFPFGASPRQADVLIVAGTLTTWMAGPLIRLWEQMPEPKWCVALGDCTCSGGRYKRSYSTIQGIDRLMPVDVYVPGCPRRPEALLYARTGHTATLLADGHVLVAGGGCCSQSARISAELYDPISGTWTRTGALGSARVYHTAILPADGKVLAYGGDNRSDHAAVTTAELYDPITGMWVATGSPHQAGDSFEAQGSSQANRLRDGKVLAATDGGAGRCTTRRAVHGPRSAA